MTYRPHQASPDRAPDGAPDGAPGRRAGGSPDGTGTTLLAGIALCVVGLFQPAQTEPVPTSPSFATADSNGSMIAVTGVDITGSSILYVIDTDNRQLSVYQATGGSSATSNVRWVGARRIDLDLQVDGWNDKSELGFKELRKEFEKNGPDSPTRQ